MRKLRCLDLFCCAGGAGAGYERAGFEVTGVDVEAQPKNPHRFVQGDALEYLQRHGGEFDFIHASPPCQKWSSITKCGRSEGHADLIDPVRKLLLSLGKPYVIENVPGAPLDGCIMLCGTMFGLNVIRHRYFEASFFTLPPTDCHHVKKVVKHGRKPERERHYAAVTGHFSDVQFAQESMGIDWMGQKELAQAIPPAYTEFLGRQAMRLIFDSQFS